MTELIVAPQLEQTLSNLKKHPVQAVLLHGVEGVGLKTIAQSIVGKSYTLIQPTTAKGDYDATSGSISIEKIRELYTQTRSNATHYIIVDDANRMTLPAQNSFLKLLEEPGKNTYFILTTHHPERLLPTIISRVTSYHVPVVSQKSSQTILLARQLDETQKRQALFLASGRPAELIRLSTNPELLSAHGETMSIARTFLSDKSRYRRLSAALAKATSRSSAIELIDSALLIIQHTLYSDISEESAYTAKRLLELRDAISNNANPRLQLTRFVLQ